jgi:1-acyl-sn-glycerol-3-phosphate acyltransferase
VRGYFRRNFHGVRVRGADRLAEIPGPLIVYANHASWWDPMVSFLLAERLFPSRRHFAPMDARALARYRLLGKFGIFGVEMDTPRGAVQFLRSGAAVLASGGVLWITPQGKFVDSRTRPLVFKPGLAALAARAATAQGGCTVLPLAIEYCFWDERTPECLLEFGAPLLIPPGTTASALEGRFESALESAMNSLRQAAIERNPRLFTELSAGRAGTGGFYAFGKRIKALFLRQQYQPEHTIVADDGSRG